MEDIYKVLELSVNANRKAIKEAYYRLAKVYHPDHRGDNDIAKKQFFALNDAYKEINRNVLRHYHVLGVELSASRVEVNRAFSVLCERYNRVACDGDILKKQKLADIQDAYDFLTNYMGDGSSVNNEHDW